MMKTRRSVMMLMGAIVASNVFVQGTQAPAVSPAEGDPSGKWHFIFDTEGGPREFDADFKVDGKEVSGIWDKKPNVKGTYSDGKLDLEFAQTSDEVGEGTLKLVGRVSDVITGSWSFQSYSGTFKAKRPKA